MKIDQTVSKFFTVNESFISNFVITGNGNITAIKNAFYIHLNGSSMGYNLLRFEIYTDSKTFYVLLSFIECKKASKNV